MTRTATTPADFLTSLGPPREGKFVFVRGSKRGSNPRLQRVGVIELHQTPRTLADAWVPLVEAPGLFLEVRSRFSTTEEGEWDVMDRGPWGWVWWFGPGNFEIWDRTGRLWWVEPGPYIVGAGERFSRLHLKQIRFSISENLVVRRLVWELSDGTQVPIVELEDPSPLVDPTYDEHDLSTSTSWFPVLGRGLRRCLGVPFEMS